MWATAVLPGSCTTGPMRHPTPQPYPLSAAAWPCKPLGALPSLFKAPPRCWDSAAHAVFSLLRLQPPPPPSPLPFLSHCLENSPDTGLPGTRPYLYEMIPEQEKGPLGEQSPRPCPCAWSSQGISPLRWRVYSWEQVLWGVRWPLLKRSLNTKRQEKWEICMYGNNEHGIHKSGFGSSP